MEGGDRFHFYDNEFHQRATEGEEEEEDKTLLFCGCNFQWLLPATVISPERALMFALTLCFTHHSVVWCFNVLLFI